MAPRRIIRHDRAGQDTSELATYIAKDDPAAAYRFLDAVEATIQFLVSMPLAGSEWETPRPRYRGLRCFRVREFENHVVFCKPLDDGIEVVRVLHGARDRRSIFG